MPSDRFARLKNPWVVAGMVLSAVVVVGLGMFSWQVIHYIRAIKSGESNPFQQDRLKASVTKLLEQMPLKDLDLSRVVSHTSDPVLGNPNAKIHITEFLDYECPFSQKSASEVRTFMARHMDDVELTIRDFPLDTIHPDAMNASIAARCVWAQGNPDAFWAFHDQVFVNQNNLTSDDLLRYAKYARANVDAFSQCVQARTPEKEIKQSYDDGVAAGVRGTPTFFVNTSSTVPGALDANMLETIYNQLAPTL